MNSYPLIFLMLVVTASAGISLWHCATSINHMSPSTSASVRWPYVLKAGGYFIQILAVLDYLRGDPMAWPWLLLVGITLGNAGSALLHIYAKRDCRCPECPIRSMIANEPRAR